MMKMINTNGGSSVITLECVACKKNFTKTLPTPIVSNLPTVSVMLATHEKTIVCNHCGQAYFWIISAIKTQWAAHPISNEERRQVEDSNVISLH